ncbi:MAG: primosomal protein DnaI [Bacilli bacterium]|nr:primosomal protein DnaI [Bacilli bacterium]
MKKISDLVQMKDSEWNDLKQSYIKKLNNQDFVEMVNLLDLEDDELMKYTSSLEVASLEYGHCKKCPGLESCQNELKGYLYKPMKVQNHVMFEYVKCPYKQKQERDDAYQNNIMLFETPKSIRNASFQNTNRDDKNRLEISKYFKTFIDQYRNSFNPRGIYLHGNFGTGKTYLIAALFNELAKVDVKSAIVYVPEFLRQLKASFGTDYMEKYDYIKTVPLLLLDDIGAENLTPWARDEIIGTLLQYRMEENLPTFFTSNMDLRQLEEHFSSTNSGVDKLKARRIIERITYMTEEFSLTSRNRRARSGN